MIFQEMDSVLNIILSMSYYFYNLMPLTRGSRYVYLFTWTTSILSKYSLKC